MPPIEEGRFVEPDFAGLVRNLIPAEVGRVLATLKRPDLAQKSHGIRFEGATLERTLFGQTAAGLRQGLESISPGEELICSIPSGFSALGLRLCRGDPSAENEYRRIDKGIFIAEWATVCALGSDLAEAAFCTTLGLCLSEKQILDAATDSHPLIAVCRGSDTDIYSTRFAHARDQRGKLVIELRKITDAQVRHSTVTWSWLEKIFAVELP